MPRCVVVGPAPQCCAVLYPAIAEAARRVDAGAGARAGAIGLIDANGGPNLQVDRVGITYSDGRRLGDPSAPVQLVASVVGDRPIPTRALPDVVARIAVGRDPNATLPAAIAEVPTDALAVVTTTWALSRLRPEHRHRFLDRLHDAATDRPVAWVSIEGVGVAPSIPTLGDRPASGHSIVGLAILRGSRRPGPAEVDVLGRCWSRGRWLSWFGWRLALGEVVDEL